MINRKFKTPKIKYLSRAIDHLNILYNTNIQKLPLNSYNLDSNAWLAGFTDADDNFSISLEGYYALVLSDNTSQKRGRVKCVFSLKKKAKSNLKANWWFFYYYYDIIANFFKCKIYYKWVITFLAKPDSKHNLVTSCFDKYP